MKKRFGALFLVITMILTLLPINALASGTATGALMYRQGGYNETTDTVFEDKTNPLGDTYTNEVNCQHPVYFYYVEADGTEERLNISDLTSSNEDIVQLFNYEKDANAVEIHTVGVGTAAIEYERNGVTYEVEVTIGLPETGFYSDKVANASTYINNFTVTDTNNTFYFVARNGSTLSNVSLMGDFGTIAKATISDDETYVTIEVTGTPQNGTYDIQFDVQRSNGDKGQDIYACIELKNGKPALMYRNAWWEDNELVEDTGELRNFYETELYNDTVFFYYVENGVETRVKASDLSSSDENIVTISANKEYPEAVDIQVLNFGSASIQYKNYSMNVEVVLPFLDFYSDKEASSATYIQEFVVTDTQDTFYLVAKQGVVLNEVNVNLLDNSNLSATATLSADGTYAVIKLTGTLENNIMCDVSGKMQNAEGFVSEFGRGILLKVEESEEPETEEPSDSETPDESDTVFSKVGTTKVVEGQVSEETKEFEIICEKTGDYVLRYTDLATKAETITISVSGDESTIITDEGTYFRPIAFDTLRPFSGFTGTMNDYRESSIVMSLTEGKTYTVKVTPTSTEDVNYELYFGEIPTVTDITVDHESYIVQANGFNHWGLSGFPFVVTYSDGSVQHLHGSRHHVAINETDPYRPYDDYGNDFVFELIDESQEDDFYNMVEGVYPVTITVSGELVFEDVVKIQDINNEDDDIVTDGDATPDIPGTDRPEEPDTDKPEIPDVPDTDEPSDDIVPGGDATTPDTSTPETPSETPSESEDSELDSSETETEDTEEPSETPSEEPSEEPSETPSEEPSEVPSEKPSENETPEIVLPEIKEDVETDEEGVNSAPSKVETEKVVEVEKAVTTLIEKIQNVVEKVVEVVTKNVAPKMTEDLFAKAKENDKDISIVVTNENNQMVYSWTFEAKDIDMNKVKQPLDLSISFDTPKKAEIEKVTGRKNGVYVAIDGHSGELPAPAKVKTYVGNQFKNGKEIYLYYYNEITKAVEYEGSGALKVEGGYVTYSLTHCSIYFLSENTPADYGIVEPEVPDVEVPTACEHDLVHVDAVEATHDKEGNIEHWYCTKCEIFWQNEALTEVTNSKRVITPARGCADTIVFYEAVEPGCHSLGQIAHWYCTECDTYYADEDCNIITNSLSVILPATGSENVDYYPEVKASCHSLGQVEHWFCNDCNTYYADEACTIVTNAMNVILPAVGSDNVEHVAAVAPGCSSLGNTEYWYCADCDTYYADANCAVVTNSKRIILPATGCVNVKHVAAVAPTATKDGNSEYWYCEDCQTYYADENCTIVTNVKNIVVPATGEAPKTGDNANIALWVSMLGLGVVAVAASVVMKKRTF